MNTSEKFWAVVPVKTFGQAKTRLRPTLTAAQCSELARNMATDVIAALQDAGRLQGISLLGDEPVVADFARELNCAFLAEDPNSDMSSNLDAAASQLQREGIESLLVVPGDLPMLHATDIDRLLHEHSDGLSICRASRDGGTNALIISPPGAIEFCFGRNSAQRHMEAARRAGLRSEACSNAAFTRDIDTPDDLTWFCRQSSRGRTGDYLEQSGICDSLLGADTAAIA